MKLLRVLSIAGPALLAACATPPEQHAFDKSRTFALSKDAVWDQLLNHFTSNNIQIKTIEKDSGVIYAETSLSDKSMSDCGVSALVHEQGRPASLNVFVRPIGKQTQVTVNAKFQVIRQYGSNIWRDECNSTGVLERQILGDITGG